MALTGTLMELLSQSLGVAGLFCIAGYLKQKSESPLVSQLAGLGRHRPMTGLALVIFTASVVGIPPTGGFFGKYYLVLGALEQKDWIILVAVGISVLFTFYLFAKLTYFLYEHKEPQLSYGPASVWTKLPFLLLALCVLLLGLFHQEVIHNFIEPALPKAFQSLPMPNVPFLGKEVE